MRLVTITGPRQVGKTTIAHQVRQRLIQSQIPCWYIPLDNMLGATSDWSQLQLNDNGSENQFQPDERKLREIWLQAREASLNSQKGLVLFLDEIQIVPHWSNIVKGLWDEDKREEYPLRVVILGSAAWRMLIGRNESLVGRFDAFKASHWSLQEMRQLFEITSDEYIFFGGYPGSIADKIDVDDLSSWRNYINDSIIAPVIDRDMLRLQRIQKPALMRQLIELSLNYSGQIISYNKLLGHLQDPDNISTIVDYLNLLSDAGLIVALSRYTPAPLIGKTSLPKLNVLNTALMTAPTAFSFGELKASQSMWGHVVESAVGAHLFNTRETATRIHYWRDKSGNYEVDFVIARGPHLIGIEVKSGNTQSSRGLNAFKNRFPNAKTTVVGSTGISLEKFFLRTTEEWIEEL